MVVIGNLAAVGLLGGFWLWYCHSPDQLRYSCQEDHLIENLTALFFLSAGAAMTVATWRHPSVKRRRIRMILPVCWVVCFLVFAGEEASWGQRILDFDTPARLERINRQGEFNIHNIDWIDETLGGKYRWLSMMVLTSGVLMPLLAYRGPVRRLFNRVSLPVVHVHYVLFFLGGYMFGKVMHASLSNDAAEIREFVFASGYMLFGIHAAVFPKSMMQNASAPPRSQKQGKRDKEGRDE